MPNPDSPVQQTVFYSWQSDLPNSTNRGFTQKALENACRAIAADESISVEPVIDRDTAGVAGSPDISTTILAKIERAAVFVADVSIVSPPTAERPGPNPNVLVELGYAMRALGPSRVILVMNRAFGGPELLPFDLKMRRAIVYAAAEGETDRSTARKTLEHALVEQLTQSLLEAKPSEELPPTSSDEAILGIDEKRPARVRAVRRYIKEVISHIDELRLGPALGNNTYDDALLPVIAATTGIVRRVFARIQAILGICGSVRECTLWKLIDPPLPPNRPPSLRMMTRIYRPRIAEAEKRFS